MAALAACTPEKAVPSPVAANAASEAAAPSAAPSSAPATEPAAVSPSPSAESPTAAPSSSAPSSAVAPQHSLTDPASPWVIVNKHRPLIPQDFVPADLVQPKVRLAVSGEASLLNSTTAAAAVKMFGAAATDVIIMTFA